MAPHAHKTCTDWSPTRLYHPPPTLTLLSAPKPSSTPSPASSATLTPTSPSPATTPPTTTILPTGLLSASPPRMSPPPPSSSDPVPYTLAALSAAHAASPFTHLPCPHPHPHPRPALHTDAILVSCAGTPLRHGGSAAAATGVYFSASSPFNRVFELAVAEVGAGAGGRQRVSVLAGIKALEAVGEVVREREEAGKEPLSQVVVRTHSRYLAGVAAERLGAWKGRGWVNSRGRVVADVDLFWYLDRRITWLEWVGVEVLFLLVGREENEEVVRLVGEAVG